MFSVFLLISFSIYVYNFNRKLLNQNVRWQKNVFFFVRRPIFLKSWLRQRDKFPFLIIGRRSNFRRSRGTLKYILQYRGNIFHYGSISVVVSSPSRRWRIIGLPGWKFAFVVHSAHFRVARRDLSFLTSFDSCPINRGSFSSPTCYSGDESEWLWPRWLSARFSSSMYTVRG